MTIALQIVLASGLLGWAVGVRVAARVRAKKFQKELPAVMALITEGSYEAAEKALRALAERFRWPAGARFEELAYLGVEWPELDQFMRTKLRD